MLILSMGKSLTVRKALLTGLCTLSLLGTYSAFAATPELNSTQDESSKELVTPPMPAVQVANDFETYPEKENTEEVLSPELQKCRSILVSQDVESRYKKIQDALEDDYANGMPHQLKTDLIRVRKDLDGLSVKLFEINSNNSQEINHIAQLTIDYLEKMISLVPKANKIAPRVRDQYVVPFTNMSSIRAEHQDCLMKAAIEDVKDRPINTDGPSINIYRKLTGELERLNKNLYTLQTSDVQRFISYRAKILRRLEKFNKNNGQAGHVTEDIPQIINVVHTEIEKLIPGLELSKDYLTLSH